MTTWEERVAHLSERWATSSRPHRNPPTLPATSHPIETRHPSVFPAKAGNHAPPPSSSAMSPTANQPNPKITQIKRITVEAALVAAHAPPTCHPTHAPHTVIPAKAGNHAPPPSSSATSPTANKPNPKNHPNQTNHSRGSPCGCPRAPQPAIPPTRPTSVIPAKAGNHATPTPRNSPATPAELQLPPLPSFRRKPETTQPQLPGTARQHQPNCSSPPTVFPAKAGIHVPPTLKDTKPTPA